MNFKITVMIILDSHQQLKDMVFEMCLFTILYTYIICATPSTYYRAGGAGPVGQAKTGPPYHR